MKGDVAFHAAEPEKIFKAIDEFADEVFHDCRQMWFAAFSTSFRLTENPFRYTSMGIRFVHIIPIGYRYANEIE